MVGSEFPLWEQNRSNQRPNVEGCSGPAGDNSNPDRRPTNIDQPSTFSNWCRPPSQNHSRIHTRKRENDMEERVWVCDCLRLLFLFLLFCLVVQGQQWLACTLELQVIMCRRIHSAYILDTEYDINVIFYLKGWQLPLFTMTINHGTQLLFQ